MSTATMKRERENQSDNLSEDTIHLSKQHRIDEENPTTKSEENVIIDEKMSELTAKAQDSSLSINAYLCMNGNCAEALEFYRTVFNGKVLMCMKYGDRKDVDIENDLKDKVLHASLELNGTTLMLCDASTNQHVVPYVEGSSSQIQILAASIKEAERLFNELSVGGTVCVPFEMQFWGRVYGLVKDKYSVYWQLTSNAGC